MNSSIRIGTRKSILALWQANLVKSQLGALGCKSLLIPVKSDGDQNPIVPLYKMGIEGVFTKALDAALLEKKVDIAVHSLKDVPTKMAQGIVLGAVLPRGNAFDVFVYSKKHLVNKKHRTIGTGSLRRKAQWLNRYPSDLTENIRGNVRKRLEKLDQSHWQGAIFAQAGLERLNLLNHKYEVLDWMIPAPAQGTIAVSCLSKNEELLKVLKRIHCSVTEQCIAVERTFLNQLEGGCRAPIGAYAVAHGERLIFKGGLFSLNGKEAILHENSVLRCSSGNYGLIAAREILKNGGRELMSQIKESI